MDKKLRNFNYTRIEDGKIINPYNDLSMRDLWIHFRRTTFNDEFIHGDKFGIDTVFKDDPTWGAEGENALWNGDRWVSTQRDLFNIGESTLNLQNWKWRYWGLQEYSEKNKGKYSIPHEGYEKNIYFRVNNQKDQICFVDAETIRDSKKVIYVFNRKVSNASSPEDWICIPKKYVQTYNLQPNGLWELNGEYHGLTQGEIILNNKKRASEVFKSLQEKKLTEKKQQ